ncbi:hypothetical protein F5Y17DRAFT_14879 [Xylariaceae sp. FL0594]|nr:hypothetical protein F5Y17DRAFT_14879 [Xylariaceae sp. FL0594]
MATTTIFDASKSPSFPLAVGQGIFNSASPQQQSQQVPPAAHPPPPIDYHSAQGSDSPRSGSSNQDREHYRLLKKGEWLQFCRGVGILKDEESEEVIRVTSRLWPPSGFKDGLYNDVLYEKTKFTYCYHTLSIVTWLLMILQLGLSAILTALGATSRRNGTPITAIAAINTGVAGVLALMHNSGLPDRHRSNRNEFQILEEHIKAVVDTGLVPVHYTANDALAECFDMFATAFQTVQNNIPSNYTQAVGPRPVPVPVKPRASQKLERESEVKEKA